MSEDEGTISGDEMAARMGMTTEEFQRELAAVSRRPRVLVVPHDGATWNATCEECGPVAEAVERDVATTEAHRHNSDAHGDGGQVRAL